MKRFQASSLSDSYGFWPFTDSSVATAESVPLTEFLSAIAEARVLSIAKLRTFAQATQTAVREESDKADTSELQKIVDRAFSMAKAEPKKAASIVVNGLAEIAAVAAKQGAPKTREAVLKALKWSSANASEITVEEPGKGSSLLDESWFWPAVASGGILIGLGTYYFIYVRPKSR